MSDAKAVLDDLSVALEAAGVYTRGTTLFFNQMPVAPPNCMVLTEYSGAEGDGVLGRTELNIDYPNVQVLSRATTMNTARSKSHAAHAALIAANTTIGANRYLRLKPKQRPFFLKQDENNRPIYAFNVGAERKT